ncbi:MAG: DUF262 domain-containing protein [Fusobacteriaceae bacterium]
MRYELGQRVWCSSPDISDMVITEVLGNKYECRFTRKITEQYSGKVNHLEDQRDFYEFELRAEPFPKRNTEFVKNKWETIVQRNNNVVMSLRRLYQDFLEGDILVPDYQRGLVWDLEQKQSYVRNLLKRKASISPVMLLNFKNHGIYEILDGLQRLTTLFRFIENEFEVDGFKFEELNREDSNMFINHEVRYTDIRKVDGTDLTKKQKIELFLEINELGTKMSEEHLTKVKNKLKGE